MMGRTLLKYLYQVFVWQAPSNSTLYNEIRLCTIAKGGNFVGMLVFHC